MQTTQKANDLTLQVISCAGRVHQKMKNGYIEEIYQRCLSLELKKTGIHFQEDLDVPVFYDDVMVGKRRVPFLVEGRIMVELKAAGELTVQDGAQAVNYLENHHLDICLLINFGAKNFQYKKLVNQNKIAYHAASSLIG